MEDGSFEVNVAMQHHHMDLRTGFGAGTGDVEDHDDEVAVVVHD